VSWKPASTSGCILSNILKTFKVFLQIFRDKVFVQAFEKAEPAKFGQADLEQYEMNVKIYRVYKNTIDTAFNNKKI